MNNGRDFHIAGGNRQCRAITSGISMLNVWPENSLLSQRMNISPNVTYLGIAGEQSWEVDDNNDKEWGAPERKDVETETNRMISLPHIYVLPWIVFIFSKLLSTYTPYICQIQQGMDFVC